MMMILMGWRQLLCFVGCSPDGKIWGSFKEAAVHMVHMLQQEHFFNVIAPPRRSCPVCEQLDPSLIHLTHCCPMRDPEWICKVCDRIFSNSEALQIHQSAHASTNQVLKDPLKASTGSRNPFEADIASTPETNPVACGNGGSYCSSRISCHTCTTTTDSSRWICKICDTVYSNSEALRIHENGHALASQMLNTKRLITDSALQNTNCKGHHGKILSERQRQQESESKREGDKTHRNLTSREDGLTKRDLLEGMMDASQNHQRQLLQRSPIGSREECLCISCDAEQQKANPQSKHFGSSQHLSSFSHTDMLCSNNLHTHSEVAPSNSLDPIYEENPASADVSNSSDASNYSEELPPKGFHGFQMGLDENGTHVGGGYPKVQSSTEDEHGGAFESPTCHEHFHKASLFNDHLASLKTRRKKPTQVLYNSEIMGSMETLRTNFDQSITGLDMKNHLQAKLENESASVQGQPMQEIFWRMIQNSAHVGTPNGTHTSNATVTAFLEKEKVLSRPLLGQVMQFKAMPGTSHFVFCCCVLQL
jgi:rubredoxin